MADDLGSTLGEVQSEGGLVGAEVVDVEDELLGEVLGVTPDDPSYTWVDLTSISRKEVGYVELGSTHQTILVTGSVDTDDLG